LLQSRPRTLQNSLRQLLLNAPEKRGGLQAAGVGTAAGSAVTTAYYHEMILRLSAPSPADRKASIRWSLMSGVVSNFLDYPKTMIASLQHEQQSWIVALG
jgi:hypothetical protein